jgi:hypothetical protein
MPATLLNAPARPLLTALALSMAILAAALPFALRAGSRDAGPAAAHPQFARRMSSLPAIVVTAPDTADARR